MDKPHLLNVITNLRRATRNHDVMTICDALEGLLLSGKRTGEEPAFNKQLWQKQYMKEYRQGKRRKAS